MAKYQSSAEVYWKVQEAISKNFTIIQKRLPYKTGNLAYNAFKVERLPNNEFKIYIDLTIAPYAYYLNEGKPIGNSDKHKGFWDARIKELLQLIANDLKVELKGG